MTQVPAPVPVGVGTITVSMPYYRCATTIRRAVLSVLGQTYHDLRLVVVNDGDHHTPPWRYLADIDDPRLIRVDLRKNMGRYFADAAVLAATGSRWFAIHDADDWADSDWLECLVHPMFRYGSVVALAPQWVHAPGGGAKIEMPADVPKDCYPRLRAGQPFLTHIAHHATVYRTLVAQRIGGHPGYRIGFDSLMVNLMLMLGSGLLESGARYHRDIRPGSLFTSTLTGRGSPERRAATRGLNRLYRRALVADDPARVVRDDVPADLAVLVDQAADTIRGKIAAAEGVRIT